MVGEWVSEGNIKIGGVVVECIFLKYHLTEANASDRMQMSVEIET